MHDPVDAVEAEAQGSENPSSVGMALQDLGQPRAPLTVRLSRELITLLSEQLYTSASKAVEELVVNSFDADASNCWVVVPAASPGTEIESLPIIAVLDDGVGMDEAGLADLWRVGASSKREEAVETARKRRQIGKFGIGKLATYALASRITYVTSQGDGDIFSVTLSFDDFQSDRDTEADEPVVLDVRRLEQAELLGQDSIARILEASHLDKGRWLSPLDSWTLVLLEEFKPRVAALTVGRLKWVLSTAMPAGDFKLHLNGDEIQSAKARRIEDAPVAFEVEELPTHRLQRLAERSGEPWHIEDRKDDGKWLVSASLPSGVRGTVAVASETIYGGKSADLIRSHGFFINVRGRLIVEDDPLFGVAPLSYEVFNRFRAEIDADDLDADITAPRENAGSSERVRSLQFLLTEVFNEARVRYEEYERGLFKQETRREDVRQYVYPRFVERPVADALIRQDEAGADEPPGVDADDGWFYLSEPAEGRARQVAQEFYEVSSARSAYTFRLEEDGRDGRLVQFDPEQRAFIVNAEHDLSLAYKDNPVARNLLYNLAVAESLLEVYLRDAGLPRHLVGEVLEKRDGLLRALTREQVNSPAAIAAGLRDSISSERDLEISLVVAARALGFVAKHVGNGGRADGVARFADYPKGERKITLEAKSSVKTPSLGSLDFAGLEEHVRRESADGCLLISPSYPGSHRGEDAAAAQRAQEARISCWTVEQLARVVESLSSRDITAREVLAIVLTKFAPEDVASAVDALLAEPKNAPRELASAMLKAIRAVDSYTPADATRSLDMLLPEIGRAGISTTKQESRSALQQLVAASSGSLTLLGDDRFLLNTSIEELERRASAWTASQSTDRRGSTFHSGADHAAPDSSSD